MMKIRDIQFARHFLTKEVEADPAMLDIPIKIKLDGDPDIVSLEENQLVYQNPSSVTMFIFHILYKLLDKGSSDPYNRDKLGLGLLHWCRNYTYADYDTSEFPGPPVIVDFDKLPIPSMIIREIVEPIVGNIKVSKVLFMPCKFTDSCRIVESVDQLESEYNLSKMGGGYHDFPLVLCNCDIHNSAAQLSHLTVKMLENSVGWDRTEKIIRNLLLGNKGGLTANLVLILKTLRGDPEFVINFLEFLESSVDWTYDEIGELSQYQENAIRADSYLKDHIKVASPPSSTQIFKQWAQWSMLMGLIEKQLEPMRGSMWPATENVKPHEDKFRLLLKTRTDKKDIKQLNFEEMLETARDLYDHNAVEPGKLIEVMLKRNRVWK